MSATEKQVGGSHYKDLAIQPAEYTTRNGLGHMAGDAIAYITRYKSKNGKEDLLKAIHSIELLIQFEYPEMKDSTSGKHYDCWRASCGSIYRGKIDDWCEAFFERDGSSTDRWIVQDGPIRSTELNTFRPISEAEARKLVEQEGGVW